MKYLVFETYRFIFLLGIYLFFGTSIIAQQEWPVEVYVKSGKRLDKSVVRVKWIYDYLTIKGGWDVFRKEANSTADWVKLNDQPILPGDPEARTRIMQDSLLAQFAQLVDKDLMDDDHIHILILLKSCVESEDFARFMGIRYDDETATPGTSYIYRVKAAAKNSVEGRSEAFHVGHQPPVVVHDAQIVYHNETEVALGWKPEPDTYFGLDVFRRLRGKEKLEKLNRVPVIVTRIPDENGIYRYPDVFYGDTTIDFGSTYEYVLYPIDPFGEYGEPSEALSVRIGSLQPPDAPAKLDWEVDDQRPVLTWTPSTHDDIAYYEIERSRKPNSHYRSIGRVGFDQTSFTDEFVGYGLFYYRLWAVDVDSNKSTKIREVVEVQDKIPPPEPTNLVVTTNGPTITMSWDPVVDTTFWGYRAFITHIDDANDQQFSPLYDSFSSHTFYTFDVNDTLEADYIVAVASFDRAHNRSKMVRSQKISFGDLTPPETPVLVKLGMQGDSVHIDWLPSQHSDVVSYRLLRRIPAESESWTWIDSKLFNQDQTEFYEPVSRWDVDIEYALIATDDDGWHSDTSNILVLNPQDPDNPKVEFPDRRTIKLIYLEHQNAVRIKWNDKGIENLKGFVVFKNIVGAPMMPITSLIQGEEFVDSDILPGQEIDYEVRFYLLDHNFGKFETNSIKIP